ncbi:MAG: sensor histidine kinase [Opitutus sp.]
MTPKTDPASKSIRAALPGRYLTALSVHLGQHGQRNGDRAQGLGRDVLGVGFVTRDLALMHEHAVIMLAEKFDFADTGNGLLKRAGYFFTQALVPLEAAQRATRNTNRLLQERNETLRLHTAELALSNRRFVREINRRKRGEEVIKKGREQYQKLFLESQVMQRKLRRVTRQILTAHEEERKKISRELHDEVVQTLVGINVSLSALGKGAMAGVQSFKAKIARTQRLVEHSVNAVHRFARELRPAALDDLGLIPALHAFCKALAARESMKVHLTAFSGIETLGIARRTVLYRVAQEALTNVARHAHASEIQLRISEAGRTIRMEISDNGKSFDVQKTLLAKSHRLGLIGMRERMEMVGGSLEIESVSGQGTTVRAEIPFKLEKTKSSTL